MNTEIQEVQIEKYPAYKDSGVEWLGEIPAHWEVKRLKNLATYINRGSAPTYVESSNCKVINQATFSKGFFDLENIKYTHEFANRVLDKATVLPKDILLASTGGGVLGKAAFFENIDGSFIADSHVTIIRGNKIEGKFYYYILSISYNLINGVLAQGSTNQTELQREWLRNFLFPFPPIEEQTAIANFLDDRTTKIDNAISIKERQIELLKERKQILIHKAVTSGLDENVPMKDSGVEWIGKIPEHWEVTKFRYLFNLGKGLTITKENLRDEGVLCVNYGEIHSKYGFELDTDIHFLKYVKEDYCLSDPKALIKEGDFVFADTSEDIEGSGNFTYLKSENEIFAGYHTVIARPKNNIDSRFFAYEFDSIAFRNQIRTQVKGVKVYSITQFILKQATVWIPSIKEQKAIVNYLDDKTKKIDTAISLKLREIEKLKEYKSSLINSTVTGKIKVAN